MPCRCPAILCLALALPILFAAGTRPASAQDRYYVWLISDSPTDPLSNFGDPNDFTHILYLWFWCTTEDGLLLTEADLTYPPGYTVLDFSPMNGFVNVGSPTELLLGSFTCRTGPLVVGSWFAIGQGTGTFCLGPSAARGVIASTHCEQAPPYNYPIRLVGYEVGLPEPSCYDEIAASLSCTSSVRTDKASWGRLKSLYR